MPLIQQKRGGRSYCALQRRGATRQADKTDCLLLDGYKTGSINYVMLTMYASVLRFEPM